VSTAQLLLRVISPDIAQSVCDESPALATLRSGRIVLLVARELSEAMATFPITRAIYPRVALLSVMVVASTSTVNHVSAYPRNYLVGCLSASAVRTSHD